MTRKSSAVAVGEKTICDSRQYGSRGRFALSQLEQWVPTNHVLEFELGGFRLGRTRFRSLTLAVPFNKLPKDPLAGPPQSEFPSGIEMMVVSAQPVEKDLPRVTILSNLIRYVTKQENRYYIELCGSFSDYLKKLSRKARGNLGRAVRKFTEFSGGEICWREFHSGEEMLEFHRLACEVSKKTYQERLHIGLPKSDEFRLAMVQQASRGLLRGYLLFHKGRPIAYDYCAIQGETIVAKSGGYDPEFRQWSPGTVLFYLTLEKLFSEKRLGLYDFGFTEFDYKASFSTGYTRTARLLYLRRSLRNLALVGAHNALNSISISCAKLLEILRLKARVREFLGRVTSVSYLHLKHRERVNAHASQILT